MHIGSNSIGVVLVSVFGTIPIVDVDASFFYYDFLTIPSYLCPYKAILSRSLSSQTINQLAMTMVSIITPMLSPSNSVSDLPSCSYLPTSSIILNILDRSNAQSLLERARFLNSDSICKRRSVKVYCMSLSLTSRAQSRFADCKSKALLKTQNLDSTKSMFWSTYSASSQRESSIYDWIRSFNSSWQSDMKSSNFSFR